MFWLLLLCLMIYSQKIESKYFLLYISIGHWDNTTCPNELKFRRKVHYLIAICFQILYILNKNSKSCQMLQPSRILLNTLNCLLFWTMDLKFVMYLQLMNMNVAISSRFNLLSPIFTILLNFRWKCCEEENFTMINFFHRF